MSDQFTVKLFFSYSHKDECFRNKLAEHLSKLKRDKVIDAWHDRKIPAGEEWEKAIDDNLEAAHIILLLISSDFLNSDYCDYEVKRAMQRHEEKSATVVPVLLRPCDTEGCDFMKLQGLPKDLMPVSKWGDQDDAFTDIAQEIRSIAEKIRKENTDCKQSADGMSGQIGNSFQYGTANKDNVILPYYDELVVIRRALANFFEILGEENSLPKDLDYRLRQIADNYKRLKNDSEK
ncbi:toll/interleukin-1 receptor domain-containing protein [Methylovulum psychrotolerans]|uniref:TIR domain-containing protein n=1 Tax=Methylovulum psychrotolerans TaxID=1704499 RepID=A0A1Z4BTW4_9GAMM|nr:toll/interleukin-1 receptor domain-containing protein [Methylovulum psychrotolerans]ASF44745.1 hypothetical protein CEK71_00950 [Methylovulum psychrotolerans]